MKTLVFFLFLFKLIDSEIPKPVLNLPSGTIRGTFQQAENGRNYAAFEGIPYARPPVGKHRFRDPQPVKPWRGVWEANYLHTCIQYNHYIPPGKDRVIGSEDCLYLNVYTPQLHQAALLDVIVYIHGGAFMFGAMHIYGPKYLMNREVVYVNMNYRLGPLGFLSTEDSVVPGNMGMKDQAMALKWIKDNIQYFGGNPNSITLTGMSAGGASVHLHYMSPLSTGLFNRGFSLSGTALNPWVLAENSLEKAKQLASSLGCNMVTTREMVDCMRYRPARQIVQNVEQFFGFLYNPFSPFGVVVEPQPAVQGGGHKKGENKENHQPFLSEHPYQMLANNKIQNLPWITSVTQAEGLYPAAEFVSDPSYLEEVATRWNELAAHVLDYNSTVVPTAASGDRAAIAEKILREYLQERPITRDTFAELTRMVGDRLFLVDSQLAAEMHARASPSPVYYYYFNYRGKHSKSETLSGSQENFGVSHGDDTVYVLSSSTQARTTDNDIKMSEVLMDLWTSYAKNGVPNLLNVSWPRVSRNEGDPLRYLEITSPTEVKEASTQDLGNSKFWLSLPFKENQRLFSQAKDEL